MTPYRENQKALIEPMLSVADLFFGKLPIKYKKMWGKIVKVEYMNAKKCMTYQLEFEDNTVHWFIEAELLTL